MNYVYEKEDRTGARVRYSPSSLRKEQYVVNFNYGHTSISTLAVDLDDAVRKVRQVFGESAELVESDD
jgi:hypothetical protein